MILVFLLIASLTCEDGLARLQNTSSFDEMKSIAREVSLDMRKHQVDWIFSQVMDRVIEKDRSAWLHLWDELRSFK